MTVPVDCGKLYSTVNKTEHYWWRYILIDYSGTERIKNPKVDPHKYAKGFLTPPPKQTNKQNY